MGTIKSRLPELITRYLEEKNISQVKLGELLGVTDGFISRVRRGLSADSIKYEFLEKICNLLEITPNDILWQDDEETP